MLWIAALLMCCLQTVESERCDKSEIIVSRPGEELVFKFQLSDLRKEYNKYMFALYGQRIIKNEIQIQNLTKESNIYFRNMDSKGKKTIFIDGNPTDHSANKRTDFVMTNDTILIKKTELQDEDAGIYLIELRYIPLGQKVLIITGKPTIKGRSPPNPVLKAEDNYRTILQLECHSVSTSIGYCQLYKSMYIMWYKNGMRMTELDPTLSQINVTVDHNGGNFTCLATEYHPCYHRLQTTKHFDVLNIEECDNVSESETFIVEPEYAPIDLKLEPDQRKITVNTNEDLKVRCSAKCHPKCDVKWEKDFQDLESNGLVTITESMYGSDLKIVNISSFDEGVYSCLVNNIHGESNKNFTFSVRETETIVLMSAEMNIVIVAVTVVIVIIVFVIVVVIMVIVYTKYHKEKNDTDNEEPEESSSDEDESIFEAMDLHQGVRLQETSRLIVDEHIYEAMDLRQAAPLPETPRLRLDRSIYEAMDLRQAAPVPDTSRLRIDRNSYEAMDLRQAAPVPDTSRLRIDRNSYEAMDLRQGVPLPETSRFITDGRSYETIDGSYETIDGSYQSIDGSYEAIDLRQSAPLQGTSRDNNSWNGGQNKKPKSVKYDVLGVKAAPSIYTRLYQETP